MAGDVIKKVDNKPVNDIEPFKEVLQNVDISEGAQLDILPKKRLVYVTIRLISICCGKQKPTMSPLRRTPPCGNPKQGSRAKNWIPAFSGMTNTVSATVTN